jgi:CSLREA domain-containing protein
VKKTPTVLLVPLVFLAIARLSLAATIIVNSTADVVANDGQCTLREAILAANTNAASGPSGGECAAGDLGADTITFNIPGAGVHTITPVSALPAITEAVTIDGYTQPGASPNTNAFPGPLNAVLKIELDNTNSQLRFDAPVCIVRGLVINRGLDNIVINADDIVVTGNFIGTNAAGTAALPNAGGGYGIHILGTRHRADIGYGGGSATTERNLISGDALGGIFGSAGIAGNGSPDGVILGNFIGTDVTGTVALARPGAVGVTVANFTVTGNLISGNSGGGVDIVPPGNSIVAGLCGGPDPGQMIGTQRDGVSPLGNGGFGGVILHGGNTVVGGGSCTGITNVIAFNNGFGVDVVPGSNGNQITFNSIHDNASLGISLTDTATPLANDPCDADTSPGNEGQNAPVITIANVNGTSVSIVGTINGKANTSYGIDFYANNTCDPSGQGEGRTWIGSTVAMTDGTCNTNFFLSTSFPASQNIFTATATDLSTDPSHRRTSEFSACFPPGGKFYTLTPCRVIDTRQPAGPYGGPALVDHDTRNFVLAGRCGIPSTATSVAVNIAVTQQTNAPGFLTLFPGGTTRPTVSSINYKAGQTRANNAIVPLGALSDIDVYCAQGGGTVQFILDVNGYFQ